ncbi:MAG: 4-hydroxy-3-methylbut-2-enyl diphosphate reductase [Gammaproteobacteria bacterium]
MEIVLASPRGFCAGVDRAIEIVNRALDLFGAPIYVKHEVVHNKYVVDNLRAKGAIFIEDLNEVPEGSTLIYSAHGVSQLVRKKAKEREFKVFDATCPLVTKVHMEVARYARRNEECVLIGHAGHPEVEGTMGQYDCDDAGIYLVETIADVEKLALRDPTRVHYVTQTTLSVDETKTIIQAMQAKWPAIQGPKNEDICYATQNRQDAVRELADECELILVVGSPASSNSNRLVELAQQCDRQSYLIDDATEIKPDWLAGVSKVGVTAGASAPEVLVDEVIDRLEQQGGLKRPDDRASTEDMVFVLPAELR